MHTYHHILVFYILVNASFCNCAGSVTSKVTSVLTKFHLYWVHFHFFNLSVSQWCFRTSITILNYARIWSSVNLYSNISSTIIFDAAFFISLSFSNVFHYFCSFIIIETIIVFEFNAPIGTGLNCHFLSGMINASLFRASSYSTICQYKLCMYISIKQFAYVSIPCTES